MAYRLGAVVPDWLERETPPEWTKLELDYFHWKPIIDGVTLDAPADENRRDVMDKQRCSLRSVPRWIAAAAVVPLLALSTMPAIAQDPRAPDAVGSIPDQVIVAGHSGSLDLTLYFGDADGDALAYAATVSNVAIATVSVSGSILTIEGVVPGTAVVTVFASDPGGLSATQLTRVTIEAPDQAPEPVGTIPSQMLAPGQWMAISLSSYFRDPEGEPLSFSATTSSAAVASVATSGDVMTITRAGTGTAIVNAVARDPAGQSTQQNITVAAGSDQVAPATEPPGPEPQDPVPARRTPPDPPQPQPGEPAAEEARAGAESAAEARQPDPFPPRLLAGFVGSTGFTLPRGRGHVSAGYLGASPLAQVGEFGDVSPLVGQVSYGVTDDLTVTAGSGFFYYNVGGGDSDLFPYVAPRFRPWANEQVSVAVEGYVGLWLAEESLTYYGGSVASSIAVDEGLSLHASGGVLGLSATILGETQTEELGVFAVGGDISVTPELGLTGEFRRVGIEDGTNILTAALQFLGNIVAGEAGLAYYLEEEAEIRPVVSIAYRF